MSTSRNKRKRPDIDAAAAASSSRRRSREARAASSTEFDTNTSSNKNKNEEEPDTTISTSETDTKKPTTNSTTSTTAATTAMATTTTTTTALGTPTSAQVSPETSEQHDPNISVPKDKPDGGSNPSNQSTSSNQSTTKPSSSSTSDAKSNGATNSMGDTASTSVEAEKSNGQGPASAAGAPPAKAEASSATNAVASSSSPSTQPTSSSEKSAPSTGSTAQDANKSEDTSSTNDTNKPLDTREMRIRALLTHRKILLGRIQSSRTAAEHRLQSIAKGQSKTPVSKSEKTPVQNEKVGVAKGPSTSMAFLADDEEVATFREMTKLVTQTAKKSRGDGEGTGEKRTSLSLRRGSSVGKRMNAALSSLAPGTTNAGTVQDATLNQPQDTSKIEQSAKSFAKTQQAAGVAPSSTAIIRGATIASSQPIVQGRNVIQQHPHPSGKSLKTLSLLEHSRHTTIKGDGQQKYETGQKAKSQNSKSSKVNANANARMSSSSAASRSESATLPLHIGASVALPQNRLAETNISCPEAAALRERKSKIESKLAALFERQKRPSESHDKFTGTAARATTSSVAPPRKTRQKLPPPWKLKNPSLLPARRKTHWDTLLQEMAWMATDFIEERKWKLSCARTLGSSLQLHGHRAVPASKGKSGTRNNDANVMSGEGAAKASDASIEAARSVAKTAEEKYVDPTLDDDDATRNVAKRLSCMMAELGNASLEAGSLSQTDEVHTDALERYHKLYKEYPGDELNCKAKSSNPMDVDEVESERVNLAEPEKSVDEEMEHADSPENGGGHVPIDKINSFVEIAFEQVIESRKHAASRRKTKVVDGLKLTLEQEKAVKFLEHSWNKTESTGAVLVGPTSSGMTVTTCCILRKQMGHGPQMLVCPPASVIRWSHELSRFKDLRVLAIGFSGGISSPFDRKIHGGKLKAGDVIVCELSLIPRALGMLSQDISQIHSFVIDGRHPNSLKESPSRDKTGYIVKGEEMLTSHPELTTLAWWEDMLTLLQKNSARRLLVEFPGWENLSMMSSGLDDKARIQILALRTAWLLGPKIFRSQNASIHRRVVAWARRRGKKAEADKIKRIQSVLDEVLSQLLFEVERSATVADVSAFKEANIWWELRRCSLSPSQRVEYEKSCSYVRGSLASVLTKSHSRGDALFNGFKALSSALFRLRRLCIHSKMKSVFDNPSMRCRLGPILDTLMKSSPGKRIVNRTRGIFERPFHDSSSQPDLSLAVSILEGSAKLRELVSILKFECGYEIDGDGILDSLLSPDGQVMDTSDDDEPPLKVAILAVLPEVQLLVSALLTSIGIKNDLLLRAPSLSYTTEGNMETSTECVGDEYVIDESQTQGLAWAEFQRILASFNSHTMDRPSVGSSVTNVVIASPASVAGNNGGLGVEMADMVICLDEDWSGRGEFMMKHLVLRHFLKTKISGQDHPSFVRLVCADTFEEKLLASVEPKESQSGGDITNWITRWSGSLVLSESFKECSNVSRRLRSSTPSTIFEFPGLNLFRFRGQCLSEVLWLSKALPLSFGQGTNMQFLPFYGSEHLGDAVDRESEFLFLTHLIREEESMITGIKGNDFLGQTIPVPLEDIRFCVTAPNPSLFPKGLMTRQDLSVIGSRIFLERLVKSGAWAHLGVGTAGVPLAVLPGATAAGTGCATDLVPATGIGSELDLADMEQNSGFTGKPDDQAVSLLVYESSPHGNIKEGTDDSHGEAKSKKPPYKYAKSDGTISATKANSLNTRCLPRMNKYAACFTSSQCARLFRDGSQGCEALVYFPPLFPLLQESSLAARGEEEAIRARKTELLQNDTVGSEKFIGELPFKRKDSTSVEATNAKRLRFQQDQQSSVASGQDPLSSLQLHGSSQSPAALLLNTTPQAPLDPMTLGSPDSIAVVTTPGDFGNDSRASAETDSPVAGTSSSALGFDEDFGLLGIGVLPTPAASIEASKNASVSLGRSSSRGSELNIFSASIPCDTEEAESTNRKDGSYISLNLMVVFRKKRSRVLSSFSDATGQYHRTTNFKDANWSGHTSLHPGMPMMLHDVNGSNPGKKFKKKASQSALPMPVSAFSRLPNQDMSHGRLSVQIPMTMQFGKGKDGARHRLLSSFASRQMGTGLSMFESTSYRIAAIRVQHRIEDRVAKRKVETATANDLGLGVPLPLSKQGVVGKRGAPDGDTRAWTSIVKRLKKNSTTGDAAKTFGSSQRSALRRSLVSPCRVDFGPFRGGFMSLPAGMTGISPPKSRLGVSLPMGVKVPQALREQIQLAWTQGDDELLQDCAVRFGMNWMLVARAISGFEDVVVTPKNGNRSETIRRPRAMPRSARQCRDRWQALARSQPSLANEVRKSERVLRESALMRMDRIPGGDMNALRIGGSLEVPGDVPLLFSVLAKPSLFSKDSKASATELETTNSTKQPSDGILGHAGPNIPLDVGKGNSNIIGCDGSKKQRRSMSVLLRAKTMNQIIPMAIPGGVGNNLVRGGPLPPLVPSHPSHMQSVQASVAAQWSSGRTEMWPLQILDFADKHHAAASQRPSSSPAPNVPSPSNAATASTTRRQATSSGASSHSHRENAPFSNGPRGRPSSFPPVPASNSRSGPQRQETPSISPQMSVQSTPTTVQSYTPPPSAQHQLDESRSNQKPPSGT